MALSTKQRNALPASAYAEPAARKFPIKKMQNGKLVPDPKHISAAKGYIRYASPSAKAKINSAYSAQHTPSVSRALTNAQKPLSSLMRGGK